MPTSEPYRLHTSLLYQLTLTSRLQERRLEDGLRSLGLTRISWCVLLALGNEGLVQPSDIAEFIGIDRTATSRALRAMEAAGLVARRTGTEPDRRRRRVALTEEGARRLAAATPIAIENGRHFLDKLDEGDAVETLRHLLTRLREGEPRNLLDF